MDIYGFGDGDRGQGPGKLQAYHRGLPVLPVRVLLVLVYVNSENKARHYSVNLLWEYSDYWKSFDSMTVIENMKSMKYLVM